MFSFREWLLEPVIHLIRRVTMNQAELAQELTNLATQTEKSNREVSEKLGELNQRIIELQDTIANGGNTSPEVDAALAAVKAAVQAIDDLHPDNAEPTP